MGFHTLKNAESLRVDPSKTIIGGGSAGANVAAVISRLVRDEGLDNIKGQLLNIPVTCHPDHHPQELGCRSYEENADAPIVSAHRMRWFWANYLPRGGEEDPRASPLLATDLRGLPPALIQVAGMDPLRDEGIAYAEALKANDVDVTLKIYPGLPHAFYTYPEMRSTIEYQETMVDWFGRILSREK
ncbi:Lipase esterase family protein [Fusarium falciforme]|uniref:Lipase esterase family protein n=1 Tax=Fusarium falciforme TaxID=195108 RepID=UPI00230164A5|nr:Lipase esterase family protein [Fusarium falciforme]WAO94373.1 Lipase esterase family protein [Fusarium falciforme]